MRYLDGVEDETGWPTALHLAQRRLMDFSLFQDPDRFVAVPRYKVTPQLAEVGCKGVLVADTLLELEQMCCAERMKLASVLASE